MQWLQPFNLAGTHIDVESQQIVVHRHAAK